MVELSRHLQAAGAIFIAFDLSLADYQLASHNKKTPLERISAKWGVHHERISKSAVNTCCNAICQAIFFIGKTVSQLVYQGQT